MPLRLEKVLLLILLLSLLAPAGLAAGQKLDDTGWGDRAPTRGVRLLSSTDAGLTFEVSVPWEQLRLDPVTEGGKEYVRALLPDWSTSAAPGAPALPLWTQSIGAPFGATLSVEVEPGTAHRWALAAPILPAATQRVEWPLPAGQGEIPPLPVSALVIQEDPAIYGRDAVYPGPLAEVASDGVMRQQRVAGIAAYPVQYDPATQELVVYESLRITVAFAGSHRGARGPAAESAAYERLLEQELLNYDTARPWRQGVVSDASSLAPSSTLVQELKAAVLEMPEAPPALGWRVKVRDEGLYKLSYAELQAAGLPVDSLDPRTFRLYHLGSEAAISVEGEGDGSFDSGDHILFYGQAVTSKYAADNVYWLTFGEAAGLRMTVRDGTPTNEQSPSYYGAQRTMEQNNYYVPGAPGDEALDRWFWAYVYATTAGVPKSWSYTFSLTAPYAAPGTLTTALLGRFQNPISPDHHAQIRLNGSLIADLWWDGMTWQTVEVAIPEGLLVAGDNILQITCPNDTGVGYDLVYVDWAELAFANTFLAEGDELSFDYEDGGAWKFQVDGFSTNQVAVYDVTDPTRVVQIENLALTGTGPYSVAFEDTLSAPVDYWATAIGAYRTVQAIEQDTASDLRSTDNGADYIVIAHGDFAAQAEQLRSWRASQGLRAMAVDVQDVYDEFGYGIAGAAPIRDFLAYAYANWVAPAPSFVVLLGDGTYDPKNYAYTRVSYIHPYLAPVDPWIGETAADNRYVTLVGEDTLPDMMLGRLSVNSTADAAAFVNKVIAYESSPTADWQGQVLAVADNGDTAGNFAQLSENLLSGYLPAPYQASKVYYGVTHPVTADARAAIQAGINDGTLIVNYIGHAATTQWAGEGLFRAADVATLTNVGKYPVVLALTCWEGYYINPHALTSGQEAVGEVVTRAGGKGAVASWSPTGLGVATGHDFLDKGFFRAVFGDPDGVISLGAATAAGKLNLWAAGYSLDLLDTYLLFGDPATKMRLPYPTAVELLWFEATGGTEAITLGWETSSEINNLGFNLYRAESPDGPRTQINAELIPSLVPPGSTYGAVYEYVDNDVLPGITYYYWLEKLDVYGNTELFGPVDAQVTSRPTNTPTATPTNTPTSTPTNTPTSTPTNTSTSTPTSTPTATPTNTPTSTPTNTPTSTPTNTPTVTPTNTPTSTPTNTPTPTPPNTATSTPTSVYLPIVHVNALDGFKSAEVKKFWTASVIPLILDQDRNPVANATVAGDWSGGVSGTSSCVTDSTGQCTCTYAKVPIGVSSVIFTVTGVTGPSLNYDSAQNNATSVTVYKDAPPATPTATLVPTATPTGDPAFGVLYVYDITMSGRKTGQNRSANAVVTVYDDTTDAPVAGATVYGTWSGDYSGSVQGTTGADGTVTFTSGTVKKANARFTFTVTSVGKAGFTYAPSLNSETEDTIVVP